MIEIETIDNDLFEEPVTVFNSGMIPLHSGSTVFVAKSDLQRIFTPKYNIYAGRLVENVFGKEFILNKIRDEIISCENNPKKTHIELDPVKMFSIKSNSIFF